MPSSLRYRLLFGFSLVIVLFASGVIMTLGVVLDLEKRTELLVDRHWKSNLLIGKTHDILGEVAIFVRRTAEDSHRAEKSRDLQRRIDDLINELDHSDFRDDFSTEHGKLLLQLRDSLSGPIELFNLLEVENQQADAALERLLKIARNKNNSDLVHTLNIAALAYRDYSITSNPSDLEIFRQQLPRISRSLEKDEIPVFSSFRLQGEKVFAERLLLRKSRDEILDQVSEIATKLRDSSERYLQRVVQPTGIDVMSGLSSISRILLLAVIGGSFVSLAVSVWLSQRLSHPMEQAVSVLSRIEDGDLSARFSADGNTESERLGQAINSLASSLHKALQDQNETMRQLFMSEAEFRRIAEERLELERIINASPTFVFFVRLNGTEAGTVAFMSQSVQQLGYRPEEFLSGEKTILSVVHPDDVQKFKNILSESLSDQFSHDFSVNLRLVDNLGGTRLMDGRFLVQRDESGVACGYQGVLVDETETSHIREQARKISHLAALGELSAGIAHEINNPNATILLNIALLKDLSEGFLRLFDKRFLDGGDFMVGRLPYSRVREEYPRLHTEIGDAADRIRRIVEDMKSFASVMPDHTRQQMNLNDIASAAIRLSHNVVKNATDHFSADLSADLPAVKVNRQQLEQVIVNLLINAAQSLSSRTKSITLRTFLDAGGTVALIIEDQGCGISPDHLPHVTDPFFTTRRDRGGTGLGLSISARIIHDHDGHLDIASCENGTVVKVLLPPANVEEAGL